MLNKITLELLTVEVLLEIRVEVNLTFGVVFDKALSIEVVSVEEEPVAVILNEAVAIVSAEVVSPRVVPEVSIADVSAESNEAVLVSVITIAVIPGGAV